MYLINLPNDIIYKLHEFLGFNKIASHNLNFVLNVRDNKRYLIAGLRIKLFIRIFYEYKVQNRFIFMNLQNLFYRRYYNIHVKNIRKRYKDINCIYYAPHVPNGSCRYCCGNKDSHHYSDRLINEYIDFYILHKN